MTSNIPYIYVYNNPNNIILAELLITKSLGDYNFKNINNEIETKKIIAKYRCHYISLVKNANNTYNIVIEFDDKIENVIDNDRIHDNTNKIKNTLMPHISNNIQLFYNDYVEYIVMEELYMNNIPKSINHTNITLDELISSFGDYLYQLYLSVNFKVDVYQENRSPYLNVVTDNDKLQELLKNNQYPINVYISESIVEERNAIFQDFLKQYMNSSWSVDCQYSNQYKYVLNQRLFYHLVPNNLIVKDLTIYNCRFDIEPHMKGGIGSVYICDTEHKKYIVKKIQTENFISLCKTYLAEVGIQLKCTNKCPNELFCSINGVYVNKTNENTDTYDIFIIMDYCGGDLNNFYRTINIRDAKYIMRLLIKIVSGIECIHANGYVHLDLKEGNILLFNDIPKIIDFGTVVAYDANFPDAYYIGTPGYYSLDMRARVETDIIGYNRTKFDIYSIGAIMLNMAKYNKSVSFFEEFVKKNNLLSNNISLVPTSSQLLQLLQNELSIHVSTIDDNLVGEHTPPNNSTFVRHTPKKSKKTKKSKKSRNSPKSKTSK